MSQTKPAIRFDSLRDGARPYPKKCQTPYPPPGFYENKAFNPFANF